jgi:hypothetical protein
MKFQREKMTNSNDHNLQIKAQELVKKHGKKAIEIAQRKINNFPKDTHSREKDFALMLLTEVENLLEKL